MTRQNLERCRIAGLDTLKIEGDRDGLSIVFFHGFGADAADLAPLARQIPTPPGTNWYFPDGPVKVPLGGFGEGRAWFPIQVAELEKLNTSRDGLDLSGVIPPGFAQARKAAMAFLTEVGVSTDRLILGGFSQGAMLATELTMNFDSSPAGLAILSGTLVNANRWAEMATQHKGMRFFQSHGEQDYVLSFSMAKRLEEMLVNAGWQGNLMGFRGGHEIPLPVISRLVSYIQSVR